jgi:hypothetical protein
MKTSETGKSNAGEPKQIAKASKGLTYLLFVFILSCISFLPSCAVELRSPQPGVSIENNHGYRHQRGYRHSRGEHRDNDDHNDDNGHRR